MTPQEIKAILAPVSDHDLQELDIAHWRYISLIGLVSGALSQDVVEADQKAYPQLIKRESGSVVFNDADCVSFMTEVTSLAPVLCEAWKNHDYYVVNGETVQETMARDGG